MIPRSALPLFLFALAFAMGGCTTQPPLQAVDAEFTLTTAMSEGRMVFIGVDGEIDGMVNPNLVVNAGDTVRIVLVNGDNLPHDFSAPDLNVQTSLITTKGQKADPVFQADQAGEFVYYCTVAGHRQMGMEGKLIVLKP